MAISAGDWASATDPFLMAADHAYTSTLGDLSNNRIILYGSEGFLDAVTTEPDIQELLWIADTDAEKTWAVNAVNTQGVSVLDLITEFGKYQVNSGGTFELFTPRALFQPDPKTTYVYVTGKASGSVLYSLHVLTAYLWQRKDPAQILFSWIAHHVDSAFTLKDFLAQTNFQDASDYYDENPIELCLWREVGSTLAEQIKKVMHHTADFLAIKPAETTGELQLHIEPRQLGLTTRTTAVDLDSASVKTYRIKPTDRYTLDALAVKYGAHHVYARGPATLPDEPGDYDTSRPLDIPGVNRMTLLQKVRGTDADRQVETDAPYIPQRQIVANHLDLAFWADNQSEIEIEFADWTHFNFEVGDKIPVSGGETELDNEYFLVTEKNLDADTLLATMRGLSIKGIEGKRPAYADTDSHIFAVTPQTLGDYFDGTVTFPRDAAAVGEVRNLDRVFGLASRAHLSEMPRGTVTNLQVDVETAGGIWPALVGDGSQGAEIKYKLNDFGALQTAAVSNFTAYWVINPHAAGISSLGYLFEQDGSTYDLAMVSSNGSGLVQFYDGSGWRGTQAAISGWQILVFVLDSGGASIRRNGADLETGLTYNQTRLLQMEDKGFLCPASGSTTGAFDGELAEAHIFKAAHPMATIQDIESHLAERYGISI